MAVFPAGPLQPGHTPYTGNTSRIHAILHLLEGLPLSISSNLPVPWALAT